jgi:hypothetical protein
MFSPTEHYVQSIVTPLGKRKRRRPTVVVPNPALQRIAARLGLCLKLKGFSWAARAEGCR